MENRFGGPCSYGPFSHVLKEIEILRTAVNVIRPMFGSLQVVFGARHRLGPSLRGAEPEMPGDAAACGNLETIVVRVGAEQRTGCCASHRRKVRSAQPARFGYRMTQNDVGSALLRRYSGATSLVPNEFRVGGCGGLYSFPCCSVMPSFSSLSHRVWFRLRIGRSFAARMPVAFPRRRICRWSLGRRKTSFGRRIYLRGTRRR